MKFYRSFILLLKKVKYFISYKIYILKQKFISLSKKRIEKFTRKTYFLKTGYNLNIEKPITFYDKINYLKVNCADRKLSSFVDKIAVKEMLKGNNFSNFAKTICIFKNIREFKKFLETNTNCSYVIKSNNTSGDVYFFINGVYKNKNGTIVNKDKVIKTFKKVLKTKYFYKFFEYPYKGIKGKIFIEELLPDFNDYGLMEFKFFCNFGIAKVVNIVQNRQGGNKIKEVFTDASLNILPISQDLELLKKTDIKKPIYYQELLDFCKKNCKELPIVRVDFLCGKDKFYFCEFTFYDCGGFNIFYPLENNKLIGDLFEIMK